MEPIGFDLKGKVAIITGGTTGIGHGIALGFARLGCHVVATSEPGTESRIQETVRELEALGVQSLEIVTDVTDGEQVETLVHKVIEKFSRLDVLVNSAGITIRRPSVEVPEEEWDKVIDVNLKGTFLTCQKVGRVMLERSSRFAPYYSFLSSLLNVL